MMIYFPLVVHGAILIEPTESESKTSPISIRTKPEVAAE